MTSTTLILAGDAGGTKTRLALYRTAGSRLIRGRSTRYVSRDYPHLADMIRAFLDEGDEKPNHACVGVPGPVDDGHARTTNLPWALSAADLARQTGIPTFHLVNDLAATAAAIPHLPADDLLTLHPGQTGSPDSPCAILAPGTGLGQAGLEFIDGRPRVRPSEGGHTDFAPRTDLETGLLEHLRRRFGHVSYERVLSGPGLVNIFKYLVDRSGHPLDSGLQQRLENEDPAEVISGEALAGRHELCIRALDVFAAVLGAQAGNLVLSWLATGGVYLGGGIPPRIRPKLGDGTLVSAYLDKGRLSDLVRQTPLRVILDDHAALLGAAHLALTD